MSAELDRLKAELSARLPEHTYKAVVGRAKGLRDDEARRAFLANVLSERERSEAPSQDREPN